LSLNIERNAAMKRAFRQSSVTTNDGFVTKASRSITQSGLENSSAKVLPIGTLLIAMYGSIEKLGISRLTSPAR
jgi:hypothetical protein